MLSAARRRAPGPSVLLVAAVVGLVLVATALWSRLPAVNMDEYLPMLPLSWFTKNPESQTRILTPYSVRIYGHLVPVLAYPYIGAVKAFLYSAGGVPTTVDAFRLANLGLLAAVIVTLLWAGWQVSGGLSLALLVSLAFILTDTSLLVLCITDEGPSLLNLLCAALLLVVLVSLLDDARAWKAVPIAAIAFVGVWDRINFGWFLAAGLAGCAAATMAARSRRSVSSLVIAGLGVAAGLYALHWLVPSYVNAVRRGVGSGIPITELPRLRDHAAMMVGFLDPFAAYHRYVRVDGLRDDAIYVAYRWTFSLLTGLVVLWGVVRGLRKRDERSLLLASFVAALIVLLFRTQEAWASHHVIVIKPFIYVTLGFLIAKAARARQLAVAAITLSLGFGAVGVRGYADLQSAPPILGVYDVSWNARDAWEAAAHSPVKKVFALDWGVFYPGLVNSPRDQLWEMEELQAPAGLVRLTLGRKESVGLLFRSRGPRAWILASPGEDAGYSVVSTQRFSSARGEEWVFVVVETSGGRAEPAAAERVNVENLVRNPRFADSDREWTFEAYRATPDDASVRIVECGRKGQRCAVVRAVREADARIVQEIALQPEAFYEVTAQARAESVDPSGKGVHLCVMDDNLESQELRGDTGWHELRFYLQTPGTARTVRLCARLGTFGSVTTGAAWFTNVSVRRVVAPGTDAPLYPLKPRP